MKAASAINILLVFVCLTFPLKGQLSDPSFELQPGNIPSGTNNNICPYLPPNHPYWSSSHGTPLIGNGGGPSGGNHCGMVWASFSPVTNQNNAEGLFTSFEFKAGKTYEVCFWASDDQTTGLGSFYMKAANGLQPLVQDCGGPTPVVSNELIGSWPFVGGNSWSQYSTLFTPTADFSQFWFYPEATGGTGVTTLKVDLIQVYEKCLPSYVYGNRSQPLPTGNIHAATIEIGTSTIFPNQAGSTDLTINDPNGITIHKAGGEVLLKHNLLISATGTGYYLATLEPCPNLCVLTKRNGGIPDLNESRVKELELFPNPAQGYSTLRLGEVPEDKTRIELLSVEGKKMGDGWEMEPGTKELQLDLRHLQPGMYILLVNSKQGRLSRKIVIR